MKAARMGHPAPERVEMASKQLMGWWVRTTHDGKPLRRFFSDREFGGPDQAHQAALQVTSQLGDRTEIGSLLLRLRPRKNNRSGIPGVARYQGGSARGPFWLAYWEENGRRVQKKFSVAVYGEQRAEELATAAREEAVQAHVQRLETLRMETAQVIRDD
jgi:hypothetical protein